MAMSDCSKCWETPCACGHDYRDWSEARLIQQIAMLEKVLAEKKADVFVSKIKNFYNKIRGR